MTKTIEEAAREFAKDRVGDYDYLGNEYEAYLDGSNDTVEWLFSLPLSQRLTDEEQDWIKKIHEDELEFAQFYQRKANSCCNQQCKIDYEVARDIAKSRAGLVEAIFGKELFGEGEG